MGKEFSFDVTPGEESAFLRVVIRQEGRLLGAALLPGPEKVDILALAEGLRVLAACNMNLSVLMPPMEKE